MKATLVALVALQFAVGSAHAFVEVIAEIVPYRAKKESAEGTSGSAENTGGNGSGSTGSKVPAAPVPVSAVATKSPKVVESQEKMLSISIRNASKRPENELIVRYWIIGRDLKTMRPSLMDGGELSTDLKPNATFTATSDPVKGTASKKMASPGKIGEATGVKVVGYVVQVIKGGKVIGEAFQESIYKKLVGSEGKTPGPFFSLSNAAGANAQ